jgi:pimeloyl-ACP methyl ester carboxylesterase
MRATALAAIALLAATATACSSDSGAMPKGARSTKIAGHKAFEEGSGTTAVVMIHGLTTHKDSWNSLLPVLAKAGYWGIAYDYDSSKSADVAEIVAYARAHGATRIVLAGSSLGAQHALETADSLHADAVVTFSSEVERTIKEPLLAIASQGDGQTATYAKRNAAAAGPHSKSIIVAGSTHGIDLVHPHPEAMTAVTDWLSTVLAR